MAFKKKRLLKISIIILVSLIAVILVALVSLNYYFKKSIENALNQSLNANVKLEKVRINIFTSSIKIKKVSIIGNNNFKNDTLVYFDKTTIKLEDYNTKTGEISFNTIEVCNPSIKIITDENGENCWQKIMKSNSSIDTVNLNNNLNIFINKISIINASITIIDKQTQSTNKFTDINFNIHSVKTQNGFNSDYKINLITENTYFNSESKTNVFNLSGKINKEYETWTGLGEGNFAWLPINLNFKINLDSINKSESFLTACFNFDNTINNTDLFDTNGKITIDFKTASQFIYDSSFNLKTNIIFDKFSLTNTDNEKLFLDFETFLSYSPFQHEKMLIKSDNLLIASNTDTITGFLNMSFTNDKFSSNTVITNTGMIDYCINDISMQMSANSNLNGIIDKNQNNLKGLFEYSFKIENKDIESDTNLKVNLFGAMDKIHFDYNLELKSDFIEGKSRVNIENISTYFKGNATNINSEIFIKKINLQKNKNAQSFDFKNKIETNFLDINFPKNINTNIILLIDSISSEEFVIRNIHATLKYGPNAIGIDSFSANLFNGSLEAKYLINKTTNGFYFDNQYSIKDIDMSAFPNIENKLEGILNISGKNSIFSTKDTVDYSQNTGYNVINLSKFKFKTNYLKEYEIDEDFIFINHANLEINLNNDSLILIPTEFFINKALLKLKGTYLISTNDIDANILINTPEQYISKKIQLIIHLISDSNSAKEKPSKHTDRLQYLLKITGKSNDPKYKVYKL